MMDPIALTVEKSSSSLSRRSLSVKSGRSSRVSKYTKASTEDGEEDKKIEPEVDYDTDLEDEHRGDKLYDSTGRRLYLDACKLYCVTPVSYFIRNMEQEKVRLNHHQVGPRGCQAISVALVSNTKVLDFSLRENGIGSTGTISLAEMLMENNYITDLDLSENRIGRDGCDAIFQMMMDNTTIQSIQIEQCKLNNDALEVMGNTLMRCKHLEYLNLSGNLFDNGEVLGRAIAENSSIKKLDLSWNQLRLADGVAVLKGIAENCQLTNIDLSHNGLGDSGAMAIAQILINNNVLESINIKSNRITLVGAVAIASGLKVNQTIKHFMVGRNEFLAPGCTLIGQTLVENSEHVLELLDLEDISVNKEFVELKLTELYPKMKIITGGSWSELKKRKPKLDPMSMLRSYMDEQGLRLVDFFNKLDTDGSMSLSREEFKNGILMAGIPMTENEIEDLLNVLDRDQDGEINYSSSRSSLGMAL